jgi:DNA-binding winged helix-turn-helix (wHTH) protein/tetratricopeptide (TPR) repeat protein
MDPDKRVLLRGNQPIPVTPKAFETLLVLVRRSRDVVTKEELLKEVWPDSFVEESNLSQNIFMLRKALGDTPENRQYIVTLPGRGYRFAASVRTVTEQGEVLVAHARARTQIVIEENEAEMEHALAPPIPQKPAAGRKFLLSIAGVAVLLAIGSFLLIRIRAPANLSEKDSILLADFVNTTGEPVFDDTLRQGLAIQLEQSPLLRIMDDAQLQLDLRLMNLQPGARITNQVAHDICIREGSAATIDGAISSLGKSYVITLQAITCQEGATLAREQIQAEDKEHVLSALGSAATAMRSKLGESLNSIQQRNRPLEQATTPSLDALQNYTAALTVMNQGHFLEAIPLFERAIAIDPNFAMAYFYLATASINADDYARASEYKKKAFALVDRVSDYERYYIAGGYFESTGELDKAIDAYRLGIANYPRDWGFHNDLSLLYLDLGKFEDGLQEGQAAAQLQPNAEPPYRRQLDAYMFLDRLDGARKVAESARTHGIDGPRIHQRFLELAYIEGDQAAIRREIQWFAGKPEEYISFGLQMVDRNIIGQRHESREFYKRAAETALRQGLGPVTAGSEEEDARGDALYGNCGTVRHLGHPDLALALALALCGDATRAEKLAAESSERFPNGTLWNAVQLPEIRAAIELQRGQPAHAVELLASVSPYERAYPGVVYLRGLAYLRLNKGLEAAGEFQKILDHKGISWARRNPNGGFYYSVSYLGLAHASELTGDTTKAKKAFQDFFALWKDADPDLPVLKQARAEYVKLQ